MADEVNPIVSEIIERVGQLKTDRATFDAHWDEIHRYVFPSITPPSRDRVTNPGEKAHAEVLDNTAENANEFLSAAVTDALTPDVIDWFQLRVTDDEDLNKDHEVAAWLEDCAARMQNVFRSPKSGYAQAAHEMRTDLVTFGTGGMAIFDMVKRQRLEQARGLAQLLEILGPLAAQDQTIMDNFDIDTIARDTADILGLYKDWMRAPELVERVRAERRQVQEQAAKQKAANENMASMADAVRAMPALRQTLASPTEALSAAA